MKTMIRLLAAAAVCALPASANAAVTFNIKDGKLLGASGVMVDGKSYDVTFADGTCANVFGNCTSNAFDFASAGLAKSAANALLDQVFVRTGDYDFDAESDLTFGCADKIMCSTIIPYSMVSSPTRVLGVSAVNFGRANATKYVDTVGTLIKYPSDDTGNSTQYNYARFTLSAPVTSLDPVAAVPEPATWALMLAGFSLTGAALRRRRTAATRVLA